MGIHGGEMKKPLSWHKMPDIYLTHYRFTLSPKAPILLPKMNKGIILRGAFGTSFRSLVCVDQSASCETCQLHLNCPFGFIFAPRVPPEAERLRLNRDIPRPFVIKPPLDEKEVYEPGDLIVFDLVLVGKAAQFFPYFLISFRNLGDQGIGKQRGKFEILKIDALDADQNNENIMKSGDVMVKIPDSLIRLCNAPPPPEGKIRIHFLTPVLLKREGKWKPPSFGTLMRRIRDRLQALSYFYCGGLLDIDFRSFGEKADQVQTVSEQLRWIEESRYSKHRHIIHDLKGWVGSIICEGQFEEFWPFLWMGQYLHVGKAAVFGQGWYKIDPLISESKS